MDRELLRRANAGDLEAREQVWAYLNQRLGTTLLRELRDNDLALELAQRTLVDLLAHTRGELGDEPAKLWALARSFADTRVMRHHEEIKRERWRAKERGEHGRYLQLILPTSMEDEFAEGELNLLADEVIGALPAELDQCLRLRSQGRTFGEIGDELGYSASTAERRWQTARQRFRRKYERARRTPPQFRSPSPPQTGS